MPLECDLENNF